MSKTSMSTSMTRRNFAAGMVASGIIAGSAVSAAAMASESSGSDSAASKTSAASDASVTTGAESDAEPQSGYSFRSNENFQGYPTNDGAIAFVADPIGEDEIEQEIDVDVVVCGAGWSGCCATAAAAEGGAKVALLQKGSVPLCNGYEVGAIGDSVHEAAGISIDKEAYISDILQCGSYRVSEGVVRRFVNRSGEALDWLMGIVGDKISEQPSPCFPDNMVVAGVNWYASAIDFTADQCVGLLPMLIEYAQSFGATDVYYDTPACQLVTDDSGAVTGVIAKPEDGGYIRFNAAKGVVLATGGYEFNWEKLKRCVRPRDLETRLWMNVCSGNTGDGQEMGLAVGGIEDEYPHCLCTDPSGTLSHTAFGASMHSFLRVNDLGQRFVNEGIPFNYLANAVNTQLGAHDWVLSDGDLEDHINQIKGSSPYTTEQEMESFLADAISADTVEELAEKMGVDADTLQATLDRYNELIDKGVDEDFNTPIENMTHVINPPFYAIDEGMVTLATESGLQVNTDSAVINGTTKRPITGLYAVGTCSGSMFNGTYPHHCSGVSLGRGLTYGMIVGRILSGAEEPVNG
jgi:fumarate reductase flavoprotein subunit